MNHSQTSQSKEKHHGKKPAEGSASSPHDLYKKSEGGGKAEIQSIEELLASNDFYSMMKEMLGPIAVAMQLPMDHMDDVLQEVCLAIVSSTQLPCFAGENRARQLRYWLRRVMRNKTVDALRRLRRGNVALDAVRMESGSLEEGETERRQHLWLSCTFRENLTLMRPDAADA